MKTSHYVCDDQNDKDNNNENDINGYDDDSNENDKENNHDENGNVGLLSTVGASIIEKPPRRLIRAFSQTTQLVCQAVGIPLPSIQWRVDGESVRPFVCLFVFQLARPLSLFAR